jgi:hypothetical protein
VTDKPLLIDADLVDRFRLPPLQSALGGALLRGQPPGTAPNAPRPAPSASACHPTVHICLHHWRPSVSPAFGFACIHRTFQTGQSIALALRYGALITPV